MPRAPPVMMATRFSRSSLVHGRDSELYRRDAVSDLKHTDRDGSAVELTGHFACPGYRIRSVKILIANRGEIAVRVIRACREMGLPTVAVYSDCDRAARHVREARSGVPHRAQRGRPQLPQHRRRSSTPRADPAPTRSIPATGSWPRTPPSPRACRDAGLTFIGPSPEAIALMGSKTAARAVGHPRRRAGRARHRAAVRRRRPATTRSRGAAARIGYPLVVKAVAGGGGKGMRVVDDAATTCCAAIRTARSEAGAAFGDTSVYLERRLVRPRHIEIQLLGDRSRHRRAVRRARVLDPAAAPESRRGVAVDRGRRRRCGSGWPPPRPRSRGTVGYTNAGTIEFLLDEDGSFYFLEMNTRLQVEHPVTEMVTGLDLVHWQIRIARGERLDIDPVRALTPLGHAIECRIYAEDPDQGFMPSPGLIRALRPASGPGIRDDGGVNAGLRGAGVLRLDDRQARRLGRLARRGDRAHVARARANTRCSASARRSRSSSG